MLQVAVLLWSCCFVVIVKLVSRCLKIKALIQGAMLEGLVWSSEFSALRLSLVWSSSLFFSSSAEEGDCLGFYQMFAKSSYTCRLRQKQQQKKALNETAAMPLMGQMEVGATIFVQRCYELRMMCVANLHFLNHTRVSLVALLAVPSTSTRSWTTSWWPTTRSPRTTRSTRTTRSSPTTARRSPRPQSWTVWAGENAYLETFVIKLSLQGLQARQHGEPRWWWLPQKQRPERFRRWRLHQEQWEQEHRRKRRCWQWWLLEKQWSASAESGERQIPEHEQDLPEQGFQLDLKHPQETQFDLKRPQEWQLTESTNCIVMGRLETTL